LISNFTFHASPPPEHPDDVAGVVVNILETEPLHNQLVRFVPPHPRTVVHCMQDNSCEICFPDLAAFCTHENSLRTITGRRIPIGFGVSSTMLQTARQLFAHPHARNKTFLANFRPSEGQSVRAALDLALIPALKQYCEVDTSLVGTGKWGDDYYSHLVRQFGCLAYGGFFSQNLLHNDWFHYIEPLKTFLQHTQYHQDTVVLRWDSWRFWESLVFGCVTVHLDFERYGLALPVLPENWKHYIGLDLANLQQDIERIRDEWERLPEIAQAGREWAIEHYRPVAVARRFLHDFNLLFGPQESSKASS
jgi:hypothetical protein